MCKAWLSDSFRTRFLPSCRRNPLGIHHRPCHDSHSPDHQGSATLSCRASHTGSREFDRTHPVALGCVAATESQRIRHASTAGTASLHDSVLVRPPLPELWGHDGLCSFCPGAVGKRDACERSVLSVRGVVCGGCSLELGECLAAAVSRSARHCADAVGDLDHTECGGGQSVGRSIDGLGSVRMFLAGVEFSSVVIPRMRCSPCPDSSDNRHRTAPPGPGLFWPGYC